MLRLCQQYLLVAGERSLLISSRPDWALKPTGSQFWLPAFSQMHNTADIEPSWLSLVSWKEIYSMIFFMHLQPFQCLTEWWEMAFGNATANGRNEAFAKNTVVLVLGHWSICTLLTQVYLYHYQASTPLLSLCLVWRHHPLELHVHDDDKYLLRQPEWEGRQESWEREREIKRKHGEKEGLRDSAQRELRERIWMRERGSNKKI